MMLSPRQAAVFADLAYAVENKNPVQTLRGHEGLRVVAGDFQINFGTASDGFKASSGLLAQKQTNFGFLATGKGSYKNNLVIAIRGTATAFDGLTDANIGVTTSLSGSLVHAGFQRCFESLMPGIKRSLTPYLSTDSKMAVHCVGHSLGGALAHMTSDWIKSTYGNPALLYSFGAPRVGMDGFAYKTSDNIEKIFRCTHGGDPVPMVPLWPFMHTTPAEFRLDSGWMILPARHKMGYRGNPGYINTADSSSWDTLKRASEQFLAGGVHLKESKSGLVSFTQYWAEKILGALITLLKAAGYYSLVVMQARISSVFTVYDFIARTMEKLAAAASDFVEDARGIISHVMRFVGMTLSMPAVLTYDFIRLVFNKMVKKLYGDAKKAIDRNP